MIDGLSFDDALLRVRKGRAGSRFDDSIDLSTWLVSSFRIQYPIISSNMDTVTGPRMAARMDQLGCLGIMHRFMPVDDQVRLLKNLPGVRVGCVGVGSQEQGRLCCIAPHCEVLLIDVAHGHSDAVIDMIRFARGQSKPILAGNVATYEGARDLLAAGADGIKCGIGPGSLCTTRINTGCGIPQLSAIMSCYAAIKEYRTTGIQKTLIADGGVKNSGDIVKALAAGADSVMIGSLFAGTKETPGRVRIGLRGRSKRYRGMASREFQKQHRGRPRSVEGEAVSVRYRGPVGCVVSRLIDGVLSGMSYQGAENLPELRQNARFVRLTQSGFRESVAHGISRW